MDDALTLVLIRWFEAHPIAKERNPQNLPLCPAPLNVNQALWRFAQTPSVRAVLFEDDDSNPTDACLNQLFMFGNSHVSQLRLARSESRSYYGLITPSSIKSLASMSVEFEDNSLQRTSTWLHTISI